MSIIYHPFCHHFHESKKSTSRGMPPSCSWRIGDVPCDVSGRRPLVNSKRLSVVWIFGSTRVRRSPDFRDFIVRIEVMMRENPPLFMVIIRIVSKTSSVKRPHESSVLPRYMRIGNPLDLMQQTRGFGPPPRQPVWKGWTFGYSS